MRAHYALYRILRKLRLFVTEVLFYAFTGVEPHLTLAA